MQSFREFVRSEYAMHSRMMLDDLTAMTDKQLAKAYGGCARTGYDLAYEVAFHNGRLLSVLKGEEPAAFSFADGWISAPEPFRSKDAALAHFAETNDNVVAAIDAASDEQLATVQPALPGGNNSLAHAVAFHAKHMLYHDAQLNFCQTLDGDGAVHWNF